MWDILIVTPLTIVLVWIYNLVTSVLGSQGFGLAIIIFTVLIRLVTWPLNAKQIKSSQAMQDLQKDKEWLAIQEKYKKDKEKLAQEQMRIYKERGINPLSGCLPTLVQLPIIFGLYQSIVRALASTPLGLLDLGRSLLAIPALNAATLVPLDSRFLWMDLGLPESIPLFGFAFPTLAIVVAITTWLSFKLTMPSNPDPKDQSAAMSNMMGIYMPLLLGYFSMSYASGLAVYFITTNLLGIFQSVAMGRANWKNLLPKQQAPAKKNK